MDIESQLKLQSFLDGELPESEAREVANWLARDSEAAALLAELRNTRQAMSGFEDGIRVPESREFFWSKIEKDILRQGLKPVGARSSTSWFESLRRLLVPAGAVAALALVALVAVTQTSDSSGSHLEAASADPGAFTYRDFRNRTTLVWLSYPAENEVAQNESASTFP
jgi:anti-sigma factor RsiW